MSLAFCVFSRHFRRRDLWIILDYFLRDYSLSSSLQHILVIGIPSSYVYIRYSQHTDIETSCVTISTSWWQDETDMESFAPRSSPSRNFGLSTTLVQHLRTSLNLCRLKLYTVHRARPTIIVLLSVKPILHTSCCQYDSVVLPERLRLCYDSTHNMRYL